MSSYKALVTGGTGAIGRSIVANLILSEKCEKITIVGRRKLTNNDLSPSHQNLIDINTEEKNSRVIQHIINFEDEKWDESIFEDIDASFCALGSRSKFPDFQKVDRDYPIKQGKIGIAKKTKYFGATSSDGASSNSFFII